MLLSMSHHNGRLEKTFERAELYMVALISQTPRDNAARQFAYNNRHSEHFQVAEILSRAAGELSEVMESFIPDKRLLDLHASMLAQVKAQLRMFEDE